MDQGLLVANLREEIDHGRVVCIVGAGVSIAATAGSTQNSNVASWKGLLEHGVERCMSVVRPQLDESWKKRLLQQIKEGDTLEMVLAAEQIGDRLGAPDGPEFRRWLRESVGALRMSNPTVPKALIYLDSAIFTTNYDGILEEATRLPTVTWCEGTDIERVLRGQAQAIVHLHGHWEKADSVIFGTRSYEKMLAHKHAQAVLRTLPMTKTLLFVGFGAGLSDPNFAALLGWMREVFAQSEHRHFQLIRESELAEFKNKAPQSGERIYRLSYGNAYSELGPFLSRLAPQKTAKGYHSLSDEAETSVQPRVLIAGPYFGLSPDARTRVEQLWIGGLCGTNSARIAAELNRPDVAQAHIDTIIRHDVLVDASPWRAFARWTSAGLHDFDRPGRGKRSDAPLLLFGFPEHNVGMRPNTTPEIVLDRLKERWPLITQGSNSSANALALSGFDGLSSAWCDVFAACWPDAHFVADFDLPESVNAKHVYRIAARDSALPALNLDAYLRALRVAADTTMATIRRTD